jgi:hypothetical protein
MTEIAKSKQSSKNCNFFMKRIFRLLKKHHYRFGHRDAPKFVEEFLVTVTPRNMSKIDRELDCVNDKLK